MKPSTQKVMTAFIEKESFKPSELADKIRKLVDIFKKKKPDAKINTIFDENKMTDFVKTLNEDQQKQFSDVMQNVSNSFNGIMALLQFND